MIIVTKTYINKTYKKNVFLSTNMLRMMPYLIPMSLKQIVNCGKSYKSYFFLKRHKHWKRINVHNKSFCWANFTRKSIALNNVESPDGYYVCLAVCKDRLFRFKFNILLVMVNCRIASKQIICWRCSTFWSLL